MNLIDKIKYAYAKGETMPLKGHAKVILADGLTGKVQEIVESDNMVTNAVADILNKNWSGCANMSALFPLRKLFGGVMCFQNPITENVNNYNPPSEAVNSMKAHAGDEAHSTASPYRGNPNGGETDIQDTSIKQVWDWNTYTGNGTISCVCLVPHTLGNMGLKPFDTTYNPCSLMGSSQLSSGDVFNMERARYFPFSIASDGKTSKSLYVDGTTMNEISVRHDYLAFGIMRGVNTWQLIENRTATLNRHTNTTIVFDDNDYYYFATATSGTTLAIDKVAKSDLTVTTMTLTFSGVSLYTGSMVFGTPRKCSIKVFAFDGRYLYYPNSGLTQFYKLDFTNPADPQLLNGTLTIGAGDTVGRDTEFATPIVISDGLVLGSNYIINSDTVYPIKHLDLNLAQSYSNNRVALHRHGASTWGAGQEEASVSGTNHQGNVLTEMFLSTINNLENPVTKSSSQTMKIEYTLTEV